MLKQCRLGMQDSVVPSAPRVGEVAVVSARVGAVVRIFVVEGNASPAIGREAATAGRAPSFILFPRRGVAAAAAS